MFLPSSVTTPGVIAASLRSGHPSFLDLPWAEPLESWTSDRLVVRPKGASRHPVRFVAYGEAVYALKGGLPPDAAKREHGVLVELERRRIPAVTPVGHLVVQTSDSEQSVLVTRYLDRAVPYFTLFREPDWARYRPHLLGALAGLLVEMHLAGVYWGDCSLFNALFLRDAGQLRAFMVDAETSEAHPQLADPLRRFELEVMEENVGLALADLVAAGVLPEDSPVLDAGAEVRRRYEALWKQVSEPTKLEKADDFVIEERIRAIQSLGFSVGEIELSPSGGELQMRVLVTDRNYHRELLRQLTGLEVLDGQAQQMLNEIRKLAAPSAHSEGGRSGLPLETAARQWLHEIFEPSVAQLGPSGDDAETYCDLLEHKWYLSEQAQRDVGREAALEDFRATILKRA